MDFDGEESTLVVGKLRGYRSWTPLLEVLSGLPWSELPWGKHSSLFAINNTRWLVNSMKARCKRNQPKKKWNDILCGHPHSAPHRTCACGIYGYYSPSDSINYFGIHGAFEAWGKVILGTSGFRCQYAKITALVYSNSIHPSYTQHVAKYYGVPVFYTIDELVKEFPESDVSNLISESI